MSPGGRRRPRQVPHAREVAARPQGRLSARHAIVDVPRFPAPVEETLLSHDVAAVGHPRDIAHVPVARAERAHRAPLNRLQSQATASASVGDPPSVGRERAHGIAIRDGSILTHSRDEPKRGGRVGVGLGLGARRDVHDESDHEQGPPCQSQGRYSWSPDIPGGARMPTGYASNEQCSRVGGIKVRMAHSS